MRESNIVFTGRITDYHESILRYSPADSLSGVKDVYDAIVFTVDEILSGELPANSNELKILVYSLVAASSGTPMVRISASPIEIVLPGIEQRNLPNGPRYLVFARQEDSAPFNRSDFYYFVTPGSVVQIMENDILGIGAAQPLNTAKVTEGEDSELVNALVLADVRGTVQVTQENNDPHGNQPQNDGFNGLPGNDSTPGDSSTE